MTTILSSKGKILQKVDRETQHSLSDYMADNIIPITIQNAESQGIKDSLILGSLTSVCVELCVKKFGKKKTIKALKAVLKDL